MIERVSVSMGRFDNIWFRIKTFFTNKQNTDKPDFSNIPVIINNFNRLEWLQQQINWLEKAGIKNIFIIDNYSGYGPLLDFYKHTKHTVFILDKNVGFLALWKTIIFQRFKNSYYVYTDPDIIPKEDCPLNAIEFFYSLLQKYPGVDKVGFGIAIDDLPDHYLLKQKVINWEQQFWQKEVEANIYEASIDTTFALYRPGVKGGSELSALRSGGKYIARHKSWYINPDDLPEEEEFYIKHANSSGSWTAELSGKDRNLRY